MMIQEQIQILEDNLKEYGVCNITIEEYNYLKENLKKAEKYRWHDLRKDKKDLPKGRTRVIAARGKEPKLYYCIVPFANDLSQVDGNSFYSEKGIAGFYEFNPDWGWDKINDVVAWRYIEPFWEVEV